MAGFEVITEATAHHGDELLKTRPFNQPRPGPPEVIIDCLD